jgi:DNA (cytosine-5)-methyltransferase 1
MNFKETRRFVSNYIDLHHKSLNQLPERDAILTHWVLNRNIRPPEMPANVFKKCCELLSQSDSSAENGRSGIRENELPYQTLFNFVYNDIPYPPPKEAKFTFIDLFAGIGGFRIAFQDVGGNCVFSSEWDKYAKKTYEANFGEVPYGDIRKIKKSSIPDHDVLLAGFPCQPFSLAGVSKKKSLGRKHGFQDETQGTLFFEIKEILKQKQPKAFMLENVKNLISHDNKHTFEVIRHTLEDVLGYVINWKIVDGANWAPQHRERIFIVGYHPDKISISRDKIVIPEKPRGAYKRPELKDIIHKKVDKKYTLGPGTWSTLERHKAHHAAVGNGFGYGLHAMPISEGAVTRTISARYHKDGAEVLISQKGDRPRRLTIEEAMQLQGYDPESFLFPVSDTQAYRQIGNSVVVPAVETTAFQISKVLTSKTRTK